MTKVEKPWGHELIWAHTAKYVGKVLHIKQGHKLSLQFHQIKEETIMILTGQMELITEEDGVLVSKFLFPGDVKHIPPYAKHRMIAVTDCSVLEVSTPELDDVVRLSDDYGRS